MIALLALPVLGAVAGTPAGFSVQLVSTFDYPGSGNSTLPQKISDSGDIVGSYIDSSGVTRGFIRIRNGSFSAPIVDPNDTGGLTEAAASIIHEWSAVITSMKPRAIFTGIS